MIPYALRPLKAEYLAIGKILVNDIYLDLDEREFVGEYMKNTNGQGNPAKARQIYYALMKDAGKKIN
jgi:hypothetical protein